MRTKFLCISVLGVASGPRMKLASCKSALNPPPPPGGLIPPPMCHFVLVFLVLLVLRLPRLGKRELILVLFVRAFVRFVLV